MNVITITRQQEVELPATIDVLFANKTTDYQQGVQQARRMATLSQQKISVALPVVLDDLTARQMAERLMYNAWVERNRFSFRAGRRYAYLEPTDVITLHDIDTGVEYVVRITKKTESRNGEIVFDTVADSPALYLQKTTTGTAPPSTQVVYVAGLTRTILLDIPMLRDVDTTTGVYLAMNGMTATWSGAALYKSADAGATYAALMSTPYAATTGAATNILGSWAGPDMFDETNTVNVSLDIGLGTLSGTSELAVLNGTNAAALQSVGGWEIIQYKNAVLESDGSYTLSGLLRGRKGSEWAMAGHASGDLFVVLAAPAIYRVDLPSAEVDLARTFKGVTFEQQLASAIAIDFTNTAVSLECYSPVHIGGGVNAAGDATINWVRRTRISGGWMDSTDVPLSEASEAYEVEVWDATYTTLKRTITGLIAQTATYAAADQVTDFGSNQAIVYVKVFQLSATNGRGYGAKGNTAGLSAGYDGPAPTGVTPPPEPGTALTPTLYVATTGSDSNDGSVSSPFLTILHASTVAVPGDVVSVASGTYTGGFQTTSSGTPSARIVYVSATKWGAKLVPPATSSSDFCWDNRGAYVTIDGFEVDGTIDPTSGTKWHVGLGGAGTGDIVQNCHVHHIFSTGTASSSGGAGVLMDSWYGYNDMHALSNVVHHVGPATGGDNWYHGIYSTATGSIKNNIAYANASSGIHMWHDIHNCVVANNTSFGNVHGYLFGGGDYVNTAGPADYCTFANNIAFDNTEIGFDQEGDYGTNNVWTNNLSYMNGTNWRLLGSPAHTNDVTADPLFVNYQADGSGDYHLQAGSPCVGAASPTYAPATDFDGVARPQGGTYDVGAYEYL